MRPVAVSTALFDGYDLQAAIGEIAAAGATFVEPAFIRGYIDFAEDAFLPPQSSRLAGWIGQAGLRVMAVSAHCDLAAHNAVDMLRRRIAMAAELGAPVLITNTGAAAERVRICAVLDGALAACADSGVTLALENPGHGEGDLIGTGADGAALVAALDSPWLRLNYDVGNVLTYSEGRLAPDEGDLRQALPAIAHLHLKDALLADGHWRYTAIGDGAIDYAALWPDIPATLPVAIELPLRLRRAVGAAPQREPTPLPLPELREALARSLRFVRGLDAAPA